MRMLLPALALCLPLCAAAGQEPPAAMPTFEGQAARPALLVGDFGAGVHYPKPESACPKNQVCIELNPPPFRFEVKVSQTIHGDAAPATLLASAGSHYGTQGYPSIRPQLAMFKTNGRDYLMLRYASASLDRKKNGDLVLVMRDERPVYWLPCGVSTLREPISPDDFADTLEIPRDEYHFHDVERNPALFRLTAKGAVPLYGIPIAKLQAYLQPMMDEDLACKAK